jgi:hypothetical protein
MTTMTVPAGTDQLLTSAAAHLYDAECALSTARATGDDIWIAAAADKLHQAVVWYEALLGSKHA